jgi:uncharacterized protein YjbI with pentapeptide repeats
MTTPTNTAAQQQMEEEMASETTLYDFEVRNRWTNAVQFTAKIEADPSVPFGIQLGFAVKWGVANKANLRDAYLRDADLRDADLGGADLRGADLRDADLRDADLRGADLRDADLRDADLSDADLRGADLRGDKIVRIFARVQRENDPYLFMGVELEAGGYKIAAGCRWFTDAEFRAHVASGYPYTPKAEETFAILDFIAARAKAAGIADAVAEAA